MKASILGVGLLASLLLGACSNAPTYSQQEAQNPQNLEHAEVVSIREVQIEVAQKPTIGQQTGQGVGAVGGAGVGSGAGAEIARILGGVFGGLLGSELDKALAKRAALEVVVKKANGEMVAIVQELDGIEGLQAGDKIHLLTRGTSVRLIKAKS